MGNSFINCAPIDDENAHLRPNAKQGLGIKKDNNANNAEPEQEEVVSYSDLHEVIKYNDSKFHYKFKNNEISQKPKGSINEQLQISYSMCSTKRFYCDPEDRRASGKIRGPSSNRQSNKSGDSHSSCKCNDVFHRVISIGGDDSDDSEGYDMNYDDLIRDSIIDQDSLYNSSLGKTNLENSQSHHDGSMTEKSSSPHFSRKSNMEGSFSIQDEDSQSQLPDLQNQCSACTQTSCRYSARGASAHREELKMMSINHQISNFYLTNACSGPNRPQSNSPCKRDKNQNKDSECKEDSQQEVKSHNQVSRTEIQQPNLSQLKAAYSNNNILNLAPPDMEDCCINLKKNPSNKINLILSGRCLQKDDCELNEQRKQLLKRVQADRKKRIFTKEYKLSRREIIYKTSVIVHKLIVQFMNRVIVRVDAEGQPLPRTEDQLCCWEVKQSSLLFNEKLYSRRRTRFGSNAQGFSISKKKPLFVYHVEDSKERREDLEQAPPQKAVEVFIMKIINRIKLSNEVCLLSLIFIERLAKKGGVQILSFNWKPIIFTAILLAAKFWEDMNLWSRDFSDALDIYPLKAVNQLESTFLALSNYELYVSEDHYDNYYEKIIKRTQKLKNKQDKSTKDPSSEDCGEDEEY